jgi:hypothetical protein
MDLAPAYDGAPPPYSGARPEPTAAAEFFDAAERLAVGATITIGGWEMGRKALYLEALRLGDPRARWAIAQCLGPGEEAHLPDGTSATAFDIAISCLGDRPEVYDFAARAYPDETPSGAPTRLELRRRAAELGPTARRLVVLADEVGNEAATTLKGEQYTGEDLLNLALRTSPGDAEAACALAHLWATDSGYVGGHVGRDAGTERARDLYLMAIRGNRNYYPAYAGLAYLLKSKGGTARLPDGQLAGARELWQILAERPEQGSEPHIELYNLASNDAERMAHAQKALASGMMCAPFCVRLYRDLGGALGAFMIPRISGNAVRLRGIDYLNVAMMMFPDPSLVRECVELYVQSGSRRALKTPGGVFHRAEALVYLIERGCPGHWEELSGMFRGTRAVAGEVLTPTQAYLRSATPTILGLLHRITDEEKVVDARLGPGVITRRRILEVHAWPSEWKAQFPEESRPRYPDKQDFRWTSMTPRERYCHRLAWRRATIPAYIVPPSSEPPNDPVACAAAIESGWATGGAWHRRIAQDLAPGGEIRIGDRRWKRGDLLLHAARVDSNGYAELLECSPGDFAHKIRGPFDRFRKWIFTQTIKTGGMSYSVMCAIARSMRTGDRVLIDGRNLTKLELYVAMEGWSRDQPQAWPRESILLRIAKLLPRGTPSNYTRYTVELRDGRVLNRPELAIEALKECPVSWEAHYLLWEMRDLRVSSGKFRRSFPDPTPQDPNRVSWADVETFLPDGRKFDALYSLGEALRLDVTNSITPLIFEHGFPRLLAPDQERQVSRWPSDDGTCYFLSEIVRVLGDGTVMDAQWLISRWMKHFPQSSGYYTLLAKWLWDSRVQTPEWDNWKKVAAAHGSICQKTYVRMKQAYGDNMPFRVTCSSHCSVTSKCVHPPQTNVNEKGTHLLFTPDGKIPMLDGRRLGPVELMAEAIKIDGPTMNTLELLKKYMGKDDCVTIAEKVYDINGLQEIERDVQVMEIAQKINPVSRGSRSEIARLIGVLLPDEKVMIGGREYTFQDLRAMLEQ